MTMVKRILTGLVALVIAGVIWLPSMHLVFTRPVSDFRRTEGLSLEARQLAARHLQLWNDPALRENELQRMRASNAEWDFMGRSFLVWSLANMGLRDPQSKQIYLQTMDRIIDETLRLEKEKGMYFFLMDYAKASHYVMKPERSLFLDGEIALMLASRRMVEEKPEYKTLLKERIDVMTERLQNSPHFVIESYPDECWMFDHCVALDAMKMADYLDGTDHSKLIFDGFRWLKRNSWTRIRDCCFRVLRRIMCRWAGRKVQVFGWSLIVSRFWIRILPAINISARENNWARSRWVLVTRTSGRKRGKGRQTLTPGLSFRCSISAPVPAAWRSSARAPLTTKLF